MPKTPLSAAELSRILDQYPGVGTAARQKILAGSSVFAPRAGAHALKDFVLAGSPLDVPETPDTGEDDRPIAKSAPTPRPPSNAPSLIDEAKGIKSPTTGRTAAQSLIDEAKGIKPPTTDRASVQSLIEEAKSDDGFFPGAA